VPGRLEGIVNEEAFHAMLTLERRRAERSRKPFVLMLLDARLVDANGTRKLFIDKLQSTVCDSIRETDIIGWYEDRVVLAVIFTEIKNEDTGAILGILQSKVVNALNQNLDHKYASKLIITAHVYPENWDKESGDRVADVKLYPDLSQQIPKKRLYATAKRVMDVAGSLLLLAILSPVIVVIALAIKLTSKGPVIFKQERLGRFGRRFYCLKFRTMYAGNDPKAHREFVQGFIAGKADGEKKQESTVYKLTNDPRVTPIGRLLRKTSVDEFPQFWNVLRGEMSLVGPRPPVPYEFEVYDYWHQRRVLEVKPGVTGLWQVSGRSRTSFDDMVRLDLRYSQAWSPWLDLKILLATPRAVFGGDGAY
jgi:lipopolysaccharide/colanic/teichoic acid biosynthesis glycosyltransferase